MALRGTAMQAGLHPNPTIGYEADTVGSAGNPNYHGGYINTVVKTAGKLQLAESVANVDVWNAELMRKKARVELITQVRGAYFAALIAPPPPSSFLPLKKMVGISRIFWR